MNTCGERHRGVRCTLLAPGKDGVHPDIVSPRHGGRDGRGVWHFWGTCLTDAEAARLHEYDAA